MRNSSFIASALSATLISLAMAAVQAAEPPAPPASGVPPGPPPEAVAACQGKTEGATVSFTGRGGETLTGICKTTNGVLAARPTGGPGRHPPPQR